MHEISESASVSDLAVVGAPAEHRSEPTRYGAIILGRAIVREFARVHGGVSRNTVVGERTLLMSGCHIGHDAVIGADCEIAPNAVIGGHCTIGDGVRVGLGAVVIPFVSIGEGARVGAGAVVIRDIPPGEVWAGNPARRLDAR